MMKMNQHDDDQIVEDMISNSGAIGVLGEEIFLQRGTRPDWSESVSVVERIVNLYCDKMLRELEFTREGHNAVDQIRRHWSRILEG
jgi:hypothetical protein